MGAVMNPRSPKAMFFQFLSLSDHPRIHQTTRVTVAGHLKLETIMCPTRLMPTTSTSFKKATPRRIAYWDRKREKCNNCDHIYLKTLSQHPGFCSVDCKSNMAYLEKVNCTIQAMKEAVTEHQRMQEAHHDPQRLAKQEPSDNFDPVGGATLGSAHSLKHAQSFAEFDLDARVMNTDTIEWAFSALY